MDNFAVFNAVPNLLHHLFLPFSRVHAHTNWCIQTCSFCHHFMSYTLPSWLYTYGLPASRNTHTHIEHLCICSAAFKGVRGHHHMLARTHIHKRNMSVLCPPETSCYWQGLNVPPICMWKQANINTHTHMLNILSMYAHLFYCFAFCTLTQIYMHYGHMTTQRLRNIQYRSSRVSNRGQRSAVSDVIPPRSTVVCRAKTSAVAECVTYCRVTENWQINTHAHMHTGHTGTATSPALLPVSLSKPISIIKLLIPAILYHTDRWVKAGMANIMTGRGKNTA